MAKKIGEILVERGLLTPELVAKGLSGQKFYGGRVGSVLVEMGMLEERDLIDALCFQKKAKPAKAGALKSIAKSTLDLIPVKVAVRYRAVPISRENRRLTVAMADPNDLLALDELAFITGCNIEALLVTERTVLNALERYYGVVQQKRETVGVSGATPATVPTAARAPAAPPASAPAAMPATPLPAAPALRTTPSPFAPTDREAADVTQDLALEAAEGAAAFRPLPPAPPKPAAPPAREFVPVAASAPPAAAATRADDVVDGDAHLIDDDEGEPTEALEPEPVAAAEPPNPLEEASRRLAQVEVRDDIADVLMWCTDGLFRRSALFIFQKSRTLGWTGQGVDMTPEVVRQVVMPVEDVSIFTLVRDTPGHYLGPLPRNAPNERLVETLGGPWPPAVLVVPFGIKGRALGCLYAEDEAHELGSIDLPLLFRLLQKSGLALEILLLRSKLMLP